MKQSHLLLVLFAIAAGLALAVISSRPKSAIPPQVSQPQPPSPEPPSTNSASPPISERRAPPFDPNVQKVGPCSFQDNPPQRYQRYTNPVYGFELAFSDAWGGYRANVRVSGVDGGTITFAGLDTTEAAPVYREAFSLEILPNTAVAKHSLSPGTGPHPILLGENSEFLFAYEWGQDRPHSLTDCEINRTLSSFKLLR